MRSPLPTLLLALTASLSVGCGATTAPLGATTTARTTAATGCGDAVRVGSAAVTVEGFGGPDESLLIVTEQQPLRACVSEAGTGTPSATLAAQH